MPAAPGPVDTVAALRRFAARGLVVLGEPLRTGFVIGTAGVLAALALAGTRQ